MGDWTEFAIAAAAVLVAFAALLATIAYRRRGEHKRDFQILLERSDRAAAEWGERSDREAGKWERATQALMERIDKEAGKRERATQALMERIDREARERQERIDKEARERQEQFDKESGKRERAIQAALDRSDRNFETLVAGSNELAKRLAGIAERAARNEGTLEAMTAGERRTASKSPSATDEPHSVAAQRIPDKPSPE